MKVIVANHSGFCFGVKRAMETTFNEINNSGENSMIYTLGPLIHNQQVVDMLANDGVKVIDDIKKVSDGTVIIRSHGVNKAVYDQAEEKSINLIDATCPFVSKIQKIVKTYSEKEYSIAIIGNPDHPEVIGINGWCDNKAYIVNKKDDINMMPFIDKLCIVVQTTMPTSLYSQLNILLEEKAGKVVTFNTICSATMDRQEAARILAKKTDAMLVIGGYHSSNTQKLVEICKEEKPNSTFHIETAEEVSIDSIKKYKTIGITAGASTPKWIIDKVVKKIENL